MLAAPVFFLLFFFFFFPLSLDAGSTNQLNPGHHEEKLELLEECSPPPPMQKTKGNYFLTWALVYSPPFSGKSS